MTLSFRDLHQPGSPFVLANAWDVGSARVLAALGAKAIGTSSAALAFTMGRPDGGHVDRDAAIAHAKELSEATPLPVSADLENGFGAAPEAVEATVQAVVAEGIAGLSIEDTDLPTTASYDRSLAVARIEAGVEAAAAARAASGTDVVLVARADGLMLGHYDLDEAIERIKAFASVGADCVYIPQLPDLEAVERVCRSVSVPVNVLAAGPIAHHSVGELAGVGVARVSLGSALARATHRALVDVGRAVLDEGSLAGLGGISGAEVDALLERGAR